MSDLYYYIIDFKDIYPLRFWAILLTATLVLSLSLFLMIILIRKYIFKSFFLKKNENDFESNFKEGFNFEEKSSLKRVIAKPRVLIWLTVVQLAAILLLTGYLLVNYNLLNFESEDTSISSSKYIFGIDVSHYQGLINWEETHYFLMHLSSVGGA